jgi:hypothetical protein
LDNPSKVNTYRPISLISVLGKVMERCIYKHVYNFLLKNSIISFKMEAPSLISRGFIKSGPVAFVVSSNCRSSPMSVSVMCCCVSLS